MTCKTDGKIKALTRLKLHRVRWTEGISMLKMGLLVASNKFSDV